jgi:amino acid permease
MVAENISLGILSLPSAVATLGIVPAVILLLGLSAISWYTGYIMGQFKLRFPQIHSMGDAGELLMGRFGRELFGIGQLLFLIFLMASHILTFTVVFNTITNHGTCTIVFGVVGLVVSFIGALPRTMGKVYWMSMASCISIVTATVVTMIAIGVQAPDHVHVDATTEVSFQDAFLAVTNIIFAYSTPDSSLSLFSG